MISGVFGHGSDIGTEETRILSQQPGRPQRRLRCTMLSSQPVGYLLGPSWCHVRGHAQYPRGEPVPDKSGPDGTVFRCEVIL